MKAKEYLNQIIMQQIKIKQLTEEISMLKSNALGVKSLDVNPNKVQSSAAVEDRMAEDIIKYMELESQLRAKRWELAELRSRIVGEIHQLSDPRYIQILYMHYVEHKRLEEIACTMHKSNGEPYSYDHINALHGEALIAFQEVIDDAAVRRTDEHI